MLTTERPRDFAEVMTRLLFSVIWKLLRVADFFAEGMAEGARDFEEALLRTRSSMVSGTESLMSFESNRPSAIEINVHECLSTCSVERNPRTSALVEDLESVGRNRKSISDVSISSEDLTKTTSARQNKQTISIRELELT